MVVMNFYKTLIFERTLSRRVAPFSSKPYTHTMRDTDTLKRYKYIDVCYKWLLAMQ